LIAHESAGAADEVVLVEPVVSDDAGEVVVEAATVPVVTFFLAELQPATTATDTTAKAAQRAELNEAEARAEVTRSR
jgi:hypothetical protein